MNFEEEQVAMVLRVKRLSVPGVKVRKKGQWNKFFGDVANRIVVESLNRHLPKDYVAIGPGAYIQGIPSEFDMIVVNEHAEPAEFTNAYPRSSVLTVVEVKRTGVFYEKEKAYEKMRGRLQEMSGSLKNIPILYITFHESERLMGETKRVYGNSAFFMSTGTNYGEILPGEWRRFVESILSRLRKC